jgi:hypothetical protein
MVHNKKKKSLILHVKKNIYDTVLDHILQVECDQNEGLMRHAV